MKTLSYLKVLAAASLISLPTVALAKEVNLYDQPLPTAKVIEKIDTETGVIPIFSPKGSDWVKIGDPRNGNVGWVKSSDIANGGSFSFTQKVVKQGKPVQSYQIQIGNPPANVDSEQLLRDMQLRQQAIQQSTQQVMQEMINNINKLYKQQPELLHNNGTMPVIMPIVIIPASSLTNPVSGSVKK